MLDLHTSELLSIFQGLPIKQAALNSQNIDILPLSKIFHGFSSLLRIRIASRLQARFSNTDYSFLNAKTTLRDLKECLKFKQDTFLNDANNFELAGQYNFMHDSTSFIYSEVGVDIEHISNLPVNFFECETDELRSKILTPYETIYALSRPDPVLSVLGLFSAKEAFIKAISKTFTSNNIKLPEMNDISVLHSTDGSPYIANDYDMVDSISTSISHSNEYALSFCIVTFSNTN